MLYIHVEDFIEPNKILPGRFIDNSDQYNALCVGEDQRVCNHVLVSDDKMGLQLQTDAIPDFNGV